jgi:hypothetical protein
MLKLTAGPGCNHPSGSAGKKPPELTAQHSGLPIVLTHEATHDVSRETDAHPSTPDCHNTSRTVATGVATSVPTNCCNRGCSIGVLMRQPNHTHDHPFQTQCKIRACAVCRARHECPKRNLLRPQHWQLMSFGGAAGCRNQHRTHTCHGAATQLPLSYGISATWRHCTA